MVRSQAMPPGFPDPMSLKECQRSNAWSMRPQRQLELWKWLVGFPDTSMDFELVADESAVDLFVDGSCFHPQSPHLRLEVWNLGP